LQIRILFWPAYRPEGGLGNVMRCLTLASHLQSRVQSTFFLPNSFPLLNLAAETQVNRIARHDLPGKDHKYDLVVIDDQDPLEARDTARLIHQFMPAVTIAALDFTGKVNEAISCYINLRKYAPTISQDLKGVKYFEGLRFAIIRESFHPLRPSGLGEIPTIDNVLITFGGEDSAGWTIATVSWLEKFIAEALNITLVIGALNKKRREIIATINSAKRHKFKVFDHLSDIERRMRKCDLAFCSAGTTLMEFAFLGKAIVALPQNDMELSFLSLFEQKGYITSNFVTENDSLNSNAILELFQNPDLRATAARNGMQIIDGEGCRRIGEVLEDLIQQPSAKSNME